MGETISSTPRLNEGSPLRKGRVWAPSGRSHCENSPKCWEWNESTIITEEGPMDTKRKTAATYVRRSAADERTTVTLLS